MPLFEDHILANIFARLKTYACSDIFLPIFALILLTLYVLTRVLRPYLAISENMLENTQKSSSSLPPPSIKSYLPSLFIFALTQFVYIFILWQTNIGTFSNYDTMAFSFGHGTWQQYGFQRRFNPLVFLDLTFLFGITHHPVVLNIYILCVHALELWLLYKFFDFIKPQRRLILLGFFSVLPSTLWTLPINFTERWMLIDILLSLLCFKNFLKTHRFQSILGFLFWANVACYVKETCFLFYVMFFICLILWRVYQNDIVPASFLHPLRSIQKMPLEFLLGLSLLFWFIQYIFVCHDFAANPYLLKRQTDFWGIICLYKFELALTLISPFCVFFQKEVSPFNKLTLMAHILSVFFILFVLKLIGVNYLYGITYYVYVPMAFILMGLGCVKKNFVFYFWISLSLFATLFINKEVFEHQQGKFNLEMSEFVKKLHNTNVIIDSYSSNVLGSKKQESSYLSAFYRAFRDNFSKQNVNIKFKPYDTFISLIEKDDFILTDKAEKGDYVLIKKNMDGQVVSDITANYPRQKLFENKFYLIYRITEAPQKIKLKEIRKISE